jgi:hypothetical protein
LRITVVAALYTGVKSTAPGSKPGKARPGLGICSATALRWRARSTMPVMHAGREHRMKKSRRRFATYRYLEAMFKVDADLVRYDGLNLEVEYRGKKASERATLSLAEFYTVADLTADFSIEQEHSGAGFHVFTVKVPKSIAKLL